jgi:N,N'-diacetyllegionaminate synthase
MPTKALKIGSTIIGPGHPCFIIAEAGVNHNGSLDEALRLVDAAAACGADAVKFQTFSVDDMVTASAPKAAYQVRDDASEESQRAMLQRLVLSRRDHVVLMERCGERDIIFLSSPFDKASVDLLTDLDVAAFKIPSGELTNLPLLRYLAGHGKPLIISTGMAHLSEVEEAVQEVRTVADVPLALLHCVSNYPADPADVNLRVMETMARAFGVPLGYSDHVLGNDVSLAAVALGACVLEKHITLDRRQAGPDHHASANPEEFTALVEGVRTIEQALGTGCKEPAAHERETAAVARKSLVASVDIAAGAALTSEKVSLKRPGTGLNAAALPSVLGRKAKHAIARDALIRFEDLS